jgi:hypothetical protein
VHDIVPQLGVRSNICNERSHIRLQTDSKLGAIAHAVAPGVQSRTDREARMRTTIRREILQLAAAAAIIPTPAPAPGLTEEAVAAIDAWIDRQHEAVTRSEAIRRLLEQALAGKPQKAPATRKR